MVAEVRGDYPTESAAINAVMVKLGIGSRETLRKQAAIDAALFHATMTTATGSLALSVRTRTIA